MGKNIGNLLLLIFCLLIYFLSIRGIAGNPKAEELNSLKWRNNGPFEQTGRFALLYSIVEDHSFKFSLPLARFATPDLAMIDGNYVSLFTPGVSFIAIPGYLIGKYFGFAQVGTFAVISIFAICNIFLIRAIAVKLSIPSVTATIGGLIFAFASPAFPYAVDLYQHHISTFLILFSIYSLLYFTDFTALILVWLLFGISIFVDYPNFLMMLPIGIYALTRVFTVKRNIKAIRFEFDLLKVFTLIVIIFPLIFLLWFNQMSYGDPFRLSGTTSRITKIDVNGKPVDVKVNKNISKSPENIVSKQVSIFNMFDTRLMLNGFYIHFISQDRGIFMYTPVMIFGFIGGVIYLKKKKKFAMLFSYIILINILVYSMWGDPWGGWSFGSRYLIPAYAILSIFIAYLLLLLRARNLFLIVFFAVLSYSVAINTLGAVTSSLNPPRVEADILSREAKQEVKYTYERNMDFISNQGSKSFFFNIYGSHRISAWNYYIYLTFFIIIVFGFLILYNSVVTDRRKFL
ncbi:hypothetical protein KJ980_05985 [Patescibacteria group bacterium]|nr:hypothetical protein [Patescibacteria group bacterium]